MKREKRILVVLGNPPYNGFAGVSPDEEQGLVEPYKKELNRPVVDGGWGIRKFNLDDLYIRFFRLGERRIAEMSGEGVSSFISNFSFLGDPSFVVMRQRLPGEFDEFWFDCLNGDSRETGKLTPEGKPDPSVFSTEYNREGIRVGTAVCVMVREPKRAEAPTIRFRHLSGTNKRAELLASATLPPEDLGHGYCTAKPCSANRFSFCPENIGAHYTRWPKLVELCQAAPSNGLMEKRGGALIDIDREALEARMRNYFDADLSWEEYTARQSILTKDAARFDPRETRTKVLATEQFNADRLRRYAVRPFDTRWCYYTPIRPVWNEPRPTLWRQCVDGSWFLLSRMKPAKANEGAPVYFGRGLSDTCVITLMGFAAIGHAFPCRLIAKRLRRRRHWANSSPHCWIPKRPCRA